MMAGVQLLVGIDTFDESRGVGVGPIGMQRFESGADFFPGFIG
jgi:hypothetical protein